MNFWIAVIAVFVFSALAWFFNRRRTRSSEIISSAFIFLAVCSIAIAGGLIEALKVIAPAVFSVRSIACMASVGFIGWIVWLHGHAQGRSDEHHAPTSKSEFFKHGNGD